MATKYWSGTGTWNQTNTNWATSSGGPYNTTFNAGDDAVFEGTAGTVTVSSPNKPNSITFNVTGYTLSGGTITFNADPCTFTLGSDISATISSVLAGSTLGLTKAGAGTLTLSGTNTYTGATTVNAGTLKAGASTTVFGSVDGSVTLADVAGAVLDLDGYNVIIKGLSGGGTTGGNVTLGAGTLTVRADGGTYSGIISGTGGITKDYGGTALTLSGANTYTGTTTLTNGTITLGISGALASGSKVNMVGGTLNMNSTTQTISGLTGATGIIQGAGTLTVNFDGRTDTCNANVGDNSAMTLIKTGSLGTGILQLGNAQLGAWNGGTPGLLKIQNGTVKITATGVGDAFPVTVVGNDGTAAKLSVFDPSQSTTAIGPLTLGDGTGYGVVKSSTSNCTLAWPYNLNVGIVGNGNIIYGDNNLTLLGVGQYNNPFTFNVPGTLEIQANIDHQHQLTKSGTGTLIISGDGSSLSSTWAVTAGTLLVNGNGSSGSGAVTVSSGATLGGTGTISGAVTINDGGTIAPGSSSAATLTISKASATALALNSTSVLTYTLGTAQDKIVLSGASSNLTLDGTINVTSGAGFAAGTYDIITYQGTLTDNTLAVGSMPSGFAATVNIDSGNKKVQLVVTGQAATLFNNRNYMNNYASMGVR